MKTLVASLTQRGPSAVTDKQQAVSDGVIRVLGPEKSNMRQSLVQQIDERWSLAFAVAVGETQPQYTDLSHPGGIVCHPVFPVCIEWPLMMTSPPGAELSIQTHRLGLHVAHSIELHSELRPGQAVRTAAGVYLAERRTNATLIGIEFRTFSVTGKLLVTSRHDSLYRGVALDGIPLAGLPGFAGLENPTAFAPVSSTYVDSTNAIIYSECARIWNPIHTDVRVARAAGLPDAVLHGTEVLARAISAITQSELFPQGARVTSLACRFSGMVLPGMTLTTSGAAMRSDAIAFEVLTSDGTKAISNGRVTYSVSPTDRITK